MNRKFIFSLCFVLGNFFLGYSQINPVELNSDKIKLYTPYMAARHGGNEGLQNYKASNRVAYQKEMWYFTESFYIKRNHSNSGITMDDGMIDITRFEQYRKADTDAIVELPGFKDALVLLAKNKLIFKPDF